MAAPTRRAAVGLSDDGNRFVGLLSSVTRRQCYAGVLREHYASHGISGVVAATS